MDFLLEVARCPQTGQKLHEQDGRLVSEDRAVSYRMAEGIPVLLPRETGEAAR